MQTQLLLPAPTPVLLLPAPVIDSAVSLAKTVSSRLSGTNTAHGENCAERLGLTPIGEESSWALAVGYHKDLPNVVVKVVDMEDDGFWHFAHAIHNNEIEGEHLPVILSITEVDQWSAVVLMERLLPLADGLDEEYSHVYYEDMADGVEDELYKMCNAVYLGHNLIEPDELPDAIPDEHADLVKLGAWAEDNGMALDLHGGNWMRREDGTLVVIDPFC